MADAVKELLDELKSEHITQQELISKAIQKELANKEVKYENLDTNLKNLIMAKGETSATGTTQSSNIPKNPMKQGEQGSCDSKINTNQGVFKQICDDLLLKNNVYLWGKAGTGKTVMAKNVAKYLLGDPKDCNRSYQANKKTVPDGKPVPPYYILNCSQWTSPMQIVGGFSIRGYTEGQMELAWKYGAVFIIDELPKLDPNTAGLLNDALSMSADEGAILTSGRGEAIPKHPDFMVIGAGNTNMKTTSGNFSGNNRQDYSLVDRFVGSFYEIKEDRVLEYSLTYKAVYNISQGLRDFLQKTEDSVEAITIRSMLNFNRVYEMQMLRKLRSPLAFAPVGTDPDPKQGFVGGKTLKDSIMSFVDDLAKDRATNLKNTAQFKSLEGDNMVNLATILGEAEKTSVSQFNADIVRLRGIDYKGVKVKKETKAEAQS